MQSDGRVVITLEAEDKATAVFNKLKKTVKGLGDGAGNNLKKNIQDNIEKATGTVKDNVKKMDNSLDKSHKLKVSANTDQANRDIKKTTDSLKGAKGDIKVSVTGDADGKIKNIMESTNKVSGKPTNVKINAKGDAVKEISNVEKGADKLGKKKIAPEIKLKGGKQVQEETEKTGEKFQKTGERVHHFRDILMGTFVSQALYGAVNGLKEIGKSIIDTGLAYDKTQDTMRVVWHSLTTQAPKDGKALVKFINDISQHSIYASSTIDKMAQSFYHVHSSRAETEKWTKSFVALGSTLHMSNDALAESGTQFAKIVAGGKASSEDMSVMINRFPMFGEALQKATGKSMKQLYAMSAAGKLTAKQFTEALAYLGKKYSGSQKEALTSFLGMTMYTKSRWQVLTGDIMKSSFNLSKNARSTVEHLLSNDQLKKYAQVISKAFAGILKVFSKVLVYVDKNHTAILRIFSDLMKISGLVGKTIWKTFASILFDVAKAFGLVSGNGKKSVSPLKEVEKALNAIAKHPKKVEAVTKAVLALFAIKKASNFASSIGKVARQLSVLGKFKYSKIKNGILDIFGKGNGTSIIAKFRKAIMAVGSAFKFVAGGVVKVTKAIGKFVRVGIKNAVKGIKTLFTVMKANPWTIWVTAITAVIVILVELYKHNKKFRKFVNGIISASKKMFAGVVKWFGNMYKGVVKWISAVVKDVKKRWGSLFHSLGDTLKDFWSYVKSWFRFFHDLFTGRWSKLGKDARRIVKYMWKGVKDLFKDAYNYLNDATGGALGKILHKVVSVGKAIKSAWHNTWSAVGNFFGNIWKTIKRLAQSGMNAVIGVLRGGIGAIDKVISMFGGKKHAIALPGYVHLASGTGYRPIRRMTHAMLNDGQDLPGGSNQEAIVRNNGRIDRVPGKFSMFNIAPGENVLNASELRTADSMGIKHFDSGNGFFSSVVDDVKWFGGQVADDAGSILSKAGSWFGNLYKGIKGKAKAIESFVKDPVKSLEALLPDSVKESGQLMQQMGSGLMNGVSGAAKSWWKQLWTMADSAMNDGGGSSDLLNAVIKYGKGKPYVWGATGPNSFDCSGLVQYSLGKLGISFPHYSGDQFKSSKAVSNPQSGDLVFYGNGGSEHVGVYGGGGRFWSAQSPSAHPNIGWAPVHGFGEKFAGYRRVPGLSDKSSKSDSSKKSSSDSLIKSEVGGGFFEWIKKHLAPLFDDDSGDATGGKVSGDLIRKAAKQMGVSISGSDIARVEQVIQHESGGNATVVNNWDSNAKAGHPSKGILQFIQSTFDHYATRGHRNILSAYDQLLALFNDGNWRSDLTLGGWGPTGRVRKAFNGGSFAGLTNLLVGDDPFNRKENVINARQSTADALISDSISDRIKADPNGMYAKLNAIVTNMANGVQSVPEVYQSMSKVNSATHENSKLAKAVEKLATSKGGNVYLGTTKVGDVINKYQNSMANNSQWFAGKVGK